MRPHTRKSALRDEVDHPSYTGRSERAADHATLLQPLTTASHSASPEDNAFVAHFHNNKALSVDSIWTCHAIHAGEAYRHVSKTQDLTYMHWRREAGMDAHCVSAPKRGPLTVQQPPAQPCGKYIMGSRAAASPNHPPGNPRCPPRPHKKECTESENPCHPPLRRTG